jgi:MoaA/NifB/PqqE/SkfB family radical SAM enzyme
MMRAKILSNYIPEIFKLVLNKSKPRLVGVNLTSRCNQHCLYCEIGVAETSVSEDLLRPDDIRWVIDQMAESGIRRIAFFGGEPFLFDGLISLVEYAGSKKIRSSITTNGMTVHKLSHHEIGTLIENHAEINLSVDSFDQSINSVTRGSVLALPNALKSMEKLQQSGLSPTLLAVISRYNAGDLFNFFTTAYSHGIRQVLFQPVIYFSNYPDKQPVPGKKGINVGPEDLGLLLGELNRIVHFEQRHHIRSNVYRLKPWIRHYITAMSDGPDRAFFREVLERFECREIHAIIEIGYDGGVQPCALLPAPFSIIHDKSQGLVPLWERATKELRIEIDRGLYPGQCNGCCNHFSRNMLASVFSHPIQNRRALFSLVPLIGSRIWWGTMKKLILTK